MFNKTSQSTMCLENNTKISHRMSLMEGKFDFTK